MTLVLCHEQLKVGTARRAVRAMAGDAAAPCNDRVSGTSRRDVPTHRCTAGASGRSHHQPIKAFTLLEILIAVAVFSLVLLAINGVFYGAMRLRTKTTQALEDLAPVERAISIIKRDLAGTVPPGGLLAGSMTTSASNAVMGGGFEFRTTTAVIDDDFPWGDVQKVSYYLKSPTEKTIGTGKDLIRALTRNLMATIQEQPEEQLLLEDVERFEVSFYDGTEWRTSWASTNEVTGLPKAVQVTLELAPDIARKKIRTPVQFIVPILTSTNSATS